METQISWRQRPRNTSSPRSLSCELNSFSMSDTNENGRDAVHRFICIGWTCVLYIYHLACSLYFPPSLSLFRPFLESYARLLAVMLRISVVSRRYYSTYIKVGRLSKGREWYFEPFRLVSKQRTITSLGHDSHESIDFSRSQLLNCFID